MAIGSTLETGRKVPLLKGSASTTIMHLELRKTYSMWRPGHSSVWAVLEWLLLEIGDEGLLFGCPDIKNPTIWRLRWGPLIFEDSQTGTSWSVGEKRGDRLRSRQLSSKIARALCQSDVLQRSFRAVLPAWTSGPNRAGPYITRFTLGFFRT